MDRIDWTAASEALDAHGCALLPALLSPADCSRLSACWDERDRFRSEVVMARFGYGSGAYRYFDRPLPELVGRLRASLYPPLAEIANAWSERLGGGPIYPSGHEQFLERCRAAGQVRPTPLLLLRYEAGDWNALHQDVYGDHVFPLQVAILLSEPDKDFTGGEFVLCRAAAAPAVARRSRAVGAGRRGGLPGARACRARRPRMAPPFYAPRRQPGPLRPALHFGHHIPRRAMKAIPPTGFSSGRCAAMSAATMEYAMARLVPLFLLALLAGCARSEDAAVVADRNEMLAVEQVRTPEQDDEDIALGEWRETFQDEDSALEFGPAGAPALFSMRCAARQSVFLQRHGTALAGDLPMMLLTVGSETRRLAVNSVGGPVPMLRASLAPSDTLIRTLSAAATPISIRVGDTPPLIMPAGPNIGTFLRRCESGDEAPARTADANASAESNQAEAPPPAPARR
jgi:hypothetical protein